MTGEVLFVAGYGLVLVAVAAALDRLGRVNTNPWASRALAAYRAQAPEQPPAASRHDWPHAEVPHLHTAIGVVAAVAALLLCGGELVRHHAPVDAVVLLLVAGSAGLVGMRLLRRLRSR